MFRYDSASVAAAAFAGSAALILLSGCAQLTDLVEKRHEERFDTYQQAANDWVGVDIPAWIPSDAVDLHNTATNDETVSVIRVTSPSPLPADCSASDRRGIPALDAEWSTESWPDRVSVCGDYEVMPFEEGWLGWFTATSEGQTPSP